MQRIFTALSALAIVTVSIPVSLSAQNNKVDTTGSVGIGTTTFPNRLTIESTDPTVPNTIKMEHKGIPNSLLFLGTVPDNYPVTSHQNANILESYTDLHISAANTGKIFFETGRTGTAAPVRMILTNTGLGIGTTMPITYLNVEGGTIRHKNPAGYPWGVNIDVDYSTGWFREYSITHGATGKLFAWGASGNGSALNYAYIGGNSTSEHVGNIPWVVFKPNGNVGVGTIDPTQKFEVNGNGKINGMIITSINNPNIGGSISLDNPAKTTAGTASSWKIFNMSGSYGNSLQFWAYDNVGCSGGMCASRFTLMDNGNVGIGTNNPGTYKLAVEGTIGARRMKVTQQTWADYVFNKDYKLLPLGDVENFIKENQHLPEIPSAAEIQKEGLDLGEMNKKLLQKIEELTLYLIEESRKHKNQQEMIESLKAEVSQLKRVLERK